MSEIIQNLCNDLDVALDKQARLQKALRGARSERDDAVRARREAEVRINRLLTALHRAQDMDDDPMRGLLDGDLVPISDPAPTVTGEGDE